MLEYCPARHENYFNGLNKGSVSNMCILENHPDSTVEKECHEYKLGCKLLGTN